jgi:hypothetical protein
MNGLSVYGPHTSPLDRSTFVPPALCEPSELNGKFVPASLTYGIVAEDVVCAVDQVWTGALHTSWRGYSMSHRNKAGPKNSALLSDGSVNTSACLTTVFMSVDICAMLWCRVNTISLW